MGRSFHTRSSVCVISASQLVIESCLVESRPDQKWTHEDASEMMFDDLVKQNNIPIDQDDVNFIKVLIKGTIRHSAEK